MCPATPIPVAGHTLPVLRACELPHEAPEQRWLVRDLWAQEGVGVIGGSPKCLKSWLGLEIAVSLASETPCLGRFEPALRGRALLYMAEDAIPDVRARLESLCRHHRVELAALDIFVITASTLRIDLASDQQRLMATVAAIRPQLVLLDPLVRLHRRDENSSADMSALLGFLRQLQREQRTAVILVHHARKNGAAGQPGHALRGSSDLHAFGDSNLYLKRNRDRIVLTFEHRAASSPRPLELALVDDPAPHLEIVGTAAAPARAGGLPEEVLNLLRQAGPTTRSNIRSRLRVRNQHLGDALAVLEANRSVERTTQGWRVVDRPAPTGSRSRSPLSARQRTGVPSTEPDVFP
jgi:hypothetical protein